MHRLNHIRGRFKPLVLRASQRYARAGSMGGETRAAWLPLVCTKVNKKKRLDLFELRRVADGAFRGMLVLKGVPAGLADVRAHRVTQII